MNKIYSFIAIISICVSCSTQSEHEKIISDFLETENGTKTDLQIKYSQLEISNVSVGDSIAILQERFEAERAKKIETIEKTIKLKEESIDEQKNSKNKLVASVLIKGWEKELDREKENLEKAKIWKPDYLNRYDSRNVSEILAQKAKATFSFFNPKLQTRQEMSALFILSPDGKRCESMSKLD